MVFVVVVGEEVVVVIPIPQVATILFWAQVYLEELHQPKGQYSVEGLQVPLPILHNHELDRPDYCEFFATV